MRWFSLVALKYYFVFLRWVLYKQDDRLTQNTRVTIKKMPLMDPPTGHPKEKELEMITKILDQTTILYDYILQDLNGGKIVKRCNVANGMSAEQVTRSAIVMRLFNFIYEDLSFHIFDSRTLSRFCIIGIADKGFKKSTLNKNIKRISPEIREIISQDLLAYAKDYYIEKSRKARADSIVVESNIHKPFGFGATVLHGVRTHADAGPGP